MAGAWAIWRLVGRYARRDSGSRRTACGPGSWNELHRGTADCVRRRPLGTASFAAMLERVAGEAAPSHRRGLRRAAGLLPHVADGADNRKRIWKRSSIAACRIWASRRSTSCNCIVRRPRFTLPARSVPKRSMPWSPRARLRHYGVSVEKVEEALKAIEYPGVVSVQIIYNIFRQRPAELFFREAKARKVAIIARASCWPAVSLTGKLTRDSQFAADDHRNFNRHGEAFDVGRDVRGCALRRCAGSHGNASPAGAGGDVSMAAFALRWILMNDAVSVVIPGAKSRTQAQANAAASRACVIVPRKQCKRSARFTSSRSPATFTIAGDVTPPPGRPLPWLCGSQSDPSAVATGSRTASSPAPVRRRGPRPCSSGFDARLDDGRHERRELRRRPALVVGQLGVHEVEAIERMVLVFDAPVHVRTPQPVHA